MKTAALVLLLLTSSQPTAAALSESELGSLARNAVAKASSAWSVPASYTEADDGFIRSMPSGELKVPLAALRETLAGVPEEQWGPVIAWLMAHEVWHQAQYRAGFTLPAPDDAKRLFECEADVMAARLVTDAALTLQQGQHEPSEADAQALGSNLKTIMAAMERAEAGYSGVLSHPSGEVRQLAIRAGAGRAVYERLGQLDSDAEERLVMDRLGTIHDIKSGESVPGWAKRTCRLLLHAGDGAPSLVLGKPELNWNTNGDPPIVDYAVPFKNRGTRPIRVTLQIKSASVPRDKATREDVARWTFADAKSFQFDLQPGASLKLSDRFPWYASDALMPRLLYPGASASYYDAVLLDASDPAPQPEALTPLPSDLLRLKGFLSTIYIDAPNRFRTVAPPCPREEIDGGCPLAATIPGMADADASRDPDGSSELTFWLYEGNSEMEAADVFRAFLDKLARLYPAVHQDHRTSPEGREAVTLKPAPQASMSIVKRKRTNSSEYVVMATITPDMN